MVLEKELWVLEYSPSQNCFHSDTIERIAENNFRAICGIGRPEFIPDYIPIAYGTYERIQQTKRQFCEITGLRKVQV
jgi:hypothetical protein